LLTFECGSVDEEAWQERVEHSTVKTHICWLGLEHLSHGGDTPESLIWSSWCYLLAIRLHFRQWAFEGADLGPNSWSGADCAMRFAGPLRRAKIYTVAKTLCSGDEWHCETNMERWMYDAW
jgi:hypothetical protein